jgi:hypothetical protein
MKVAETAVVATTMFSWRVTWPKFPPSPLHALLYGVPVHVDYSSISNVEFEKCLQSDLERHLLGDHNNFSNSRKCADDLKLVVKCWTSKVAVK